MPQRIEILHFAGCPNLDAAKRNVEAALAAVSSPNAVAVQVIEVTDEQEARRLRFLGSPTVRVDGTDVDPSSFDRSGYGLQCRIYATESGIARCPPVEWITRRLRATND